MSISSRSQPSSHSAHSASPAQAADMPSGELPSIVHETLTARIKNQDIELPVLDQSINQIISLCNDPDAEQAQLVQLITQDQSLAAHLMRIANTPTYAPVEPLVSLAQVVGRLGMKKIREIALVIAMQSARFEVPGFEADLDHCRDASLAGGLFAQEIARTRRWNVEEHFLCGLLRLIGYPVALQLIVSCYQAHDITPNRTAVLATAQKMHAQLGSALIGQWKLPVRVAEVVAHYLTPATAPTTSGPSHVTNLAHALADWLLHDDTPSDTSTDALHEHPSLVDINMYADELDDILQHAESIRSSIESMQL